VTSALAMTAELGHFALWLALGCAAVLGTVPLLGAARDRADWMAVARPAARALAALLALSFACLVAGFVRNDFSMEIVASQSNSELPLVYRVAAAWGGHEGSLLLWLLMLGGWTVAVAQYSRRLPPTFVARVLAVLGLLSLGFLLFTLLTSNPFARLLPAPPDGRDLNPLLQDPGMALHPPLLYMGYVGFAVAFAFAVAALIGGQLDAAWARWTRPWTTVAWAFLTIGIALGSWWAYYELGWGGWWFWDPVENASFMPWLVGTALIHSLAVTEKRGGFKSWTVLLAICAFSLSLLGTFLVRSGVLSSVHAFATDPTRGLFILVFLVLAIGPALALYAWRAPQVGLGQRFALLSRETLLLVNNVLLVVAAAAVLLGTLYPLALDALDLGKISVGPPYFETVFVPLLAPLLFLVGVGPVARWKQQALPELAVRLRWAFAVAVVAALAALAWAGSVAPMAALGLGLAAWIVASLALELRRSGRPTRATAGMMLAHLGVAAFVVGVTMVKTFELERDATMSPGSGVEAGGFEFVFVGLKTVQGPNYDGVQALVEVRRDGALVSALRPEKRVYRVQRNPMTEAGIDSGFVRDLYVSLGEPVAQGAAWIVRVQVKPFVNWIWGGCALMALGGLLAASDRRYRVAATRRAAAGAAPLVEVRA
jgi:cytochrome c-type biogenesis protein CcmF